jgi:hypothetical protein
VRPSDTIGTSPYESENGVEVAAEEDAVEPEASVGDSLTPKLAGRPSNAFLATTESRFMELRDLIQKTVSETGVSEETILKRFNKYMKSGGTTRNKMNLYNMYEQYANHPANIRTECSRIAENVPENPGYTLHSQSLSQAYAKFREAFPAPRDAEVLAAFQAAVAADDATGETLGRRNYSFSKHMAAGKDWVRTFNFYRSFINHPMQLEIAHRRGFAGMIILVGKHVNEDGGLGELDYTPNLEGVRLVLCTAGSSLMPAQVFGRIGWEPNDLIAFSKTTA